jgi:hypothetical protein
MRGLDGRWESECEHVYTTRDGCVAAQTLPDMDASRLHELTCGAVGLTIAPLKLNRGGCGTRSIAAE